MIALPAELCSHVFRFLSVADDAASSDPDIWARIVTGNGIQSEDPSDTLVESIRTKRTLSLVSRDFYELSRPIALEIITLRSAESLRYLVLVLRDKPRLANVVRRCTKRIDVRVETKTTIDDGNPCSSAMGDGPIPRSQHIFSDLAFVLSSCPNLIYFSCRVEGLIDVAIDIMDHLSEACPSLEVLRWHFIPTRRVKLSSVLPSFSRLRVLELSKIADALLEASATYELPYLHTLIGPLEVICPHFTSIRLPCLRTLVCKRSTSFDHTQEFFRAHGVKIESLDLSQLSFFHEYEFCPNVTQVILNTSKAELFCSPWPKVRQIGITEDLKDEGSISVLLLAMLCLIKTGREKDGYAELQTIRIFSDRAVRRLRERNKRATQLVEMELRCWSVRLEDSSGDLVVPPRF